MFVVCSYCTIDCTCMTGLAHISLFCRQVGYHPKINLSYRMHSGIPSALVFNWLSKYKYVHASYCLLIVFKKIRWVALAQMVGLFLHKESMYGSRGLALFEIAMNLCLICIICVNFVLGHQFLNALFATIYNTILTCYIGNGGVQWYYRQQSMKL